MPQIAPAAVVRFHQTPMTSAGELDNVFKNLPTYLVVTKEETEVSAFFTAFAVLLAVIAMLLSFRWHPLS
jgi:hypothetical protein